jgi:hypothetical protein
MPKKVFVLILLLSLFAACENSKKSNDPKELNFNVDKTKLNEKVNSPLLGLEFNPPANWNEIDSVLIRNMKGQLKSQSVRSDSIQFSLKKVFLDQENMSMLSISELEFDNAIAEPKNYYDSRIQNKFEKASIFRRGEFLKDDIKFIQYLIENSGNVNFKLLFSNSNDKTIQFDYILTKKNYSNQIRAIESSIGSIKLIN